MTKITPPILFHATYPLSNGIMLQLTRNMHNRIKQISHFKSNYNSADILLALPEYDMRFPKSFPNN